MDAWGELRLNLIAFALVGGLALVPILSLLWRGVGRLLPLPRLKIGYWTGRTFVGHALLLYACLGLTYGLLDRLGLASRLVPADASSLRKINLVWPLATTVFLAASVSLLYSVNRTPIGRVGLTLVRWRPNLLLGCMAFLVVAPVVFGVHALVLLRFPTGKHDVERLAAEGLAGWEWALLFVQVVVAAPILEEWLFRGLLQGWLRRATLLGHAVLVWLIVGLSAVAAFQEPAGKDKKNGEEHRHSVEAIVFTIGLALAYGAGVIVLFRPLVKRGLAPFRADPEPFADIRRIEPWIFDYCGAEGEERKTEPWRSLGPGWLAWKFAAARWAIVGSATAFSVSHGWPSSIAIFLLGLALGWLAYRTQSLLPCIVLHSLFNCVSFIVLALQYYPIGNDDTVAVRPAASAIVSTVPTSWWPRLK